MRIQVGGCNVSGSLKTMNLASWLLVDSCFSPLVNLIRSPITLGRQGEDGQGGEKMALSGRGDTQTETRSLVASSTLTDRDIAHLNRVVTYDQSR